jgi:hypothetical protein
MRLIQRRHRKVIVMLLLMLIRKKCGSHPYSQICTKILEKLELQDRVYLKLKTKISGISLKGVVLVIFGISEASYGWTNADWTFLKHTLGKSIFDFAIPLDSLVPLPPIWLTAVKPGSLSFFQRHKDPRGYIGKI